MSARPLVRPPFALRALILALGASTAVGTWFGLTQREAFLVAFPGAARPGILAGLVATAALGCVALVALWQWRRWGIALYGVVVLLSIALDVIAGAPRVHQATVVIAAALVAWAVGANRGRFGPRPPD